MYGSNSVCFLYYLDTAVEMLEQDVGSLLHDPDVLCGRIGTLAILDGVDETIPELLYGTQQVLLDEVHHAVI